VDRPSRHSTCVPARRRWRSDATRRRAHTCPASCDVPRGAQSAMLRQRVDLFRPFRPRRGPHRRPSRVRPADGPRARLEPGRGPPHALAPRHSRAWALADSDLRGQPYLNKPQLFFWSVALASLPGVLEAAGPYADRNRRAMASRHAGRRVTRASGRDGGRVAPVGTRVPHLPARGCHHAVGGLPRRSGHGTLGIVPAVHDRTSTCRAARSSREPAPSVPSPAGPDGAAANLPGWRGSVRRQPSMRQRGRAMRPPGHRLERERGRAVWGSA
jgi:hypothetical protein